LDVIDGYLTGVVGRVECCLFPGLLQECVAGWGESGEAFSGLGLVGLAATSSVAGVAGVVRMLACRHGWYHFPNRDLVLNDSHSCRPS